MPKISPPADRTAVHKDSWSGLPVAVIHPSELAALAKVIADSAKPAAISLRTPKLIAEYSLVLAKSMRVSRNSLLNTIVALGIDQLIRQQRLPLDAAPLATYFDPSVEIPKLETPKK